MILTGEPASVHLIVAASTSNGSQKAMLWLTLDWRVPFLMSLKAAHLQKMQHQAFASPGGRNRRFTLFAPATVSFCFCLHRVSSADSQDTNTMLLTTGLLPPLRQTIAVLPSVQPATLSAHTLAFGRMPQGSTCCHRVLILRNALPTSAIDYDWTQSEGHTAPLIESGNVVVEPAFGRIEAGGYVLVRVRVNTLVPPVLVAGTVSVSIRQAAEIVNTKSRRVSS